MRENKKALRLLDRYANGEFDITEVMSRLSRLNGPDATVRYAILKPKPTVKENELKNIQYYERIANKYDHLYEVPVEDLEQLNHTLKENELDPIENTDDWDTFKYNAYMETRSAMPDLNFKLYSSPLAGAMAIYTSLKSENEEMIKRKLIESGNQNADEIVARAKQVQQAVDAGYSMEEIKQHLESI